MCSFNNELVRRDENEKILIYKFPDENKYSINIPKTTFLPFSKIKYIGSHAD